MATPIRLFPNADSLRSQSVLARAHATRHAAALAGPLGSILDRPERACPAPAQHFGRESGEGFKNGSWFHNSDFAVMPESSLVGLRRLARTPCPRKSSGDVSLPTFCAPDLWQLPQA